MSAKSTLRQLLLLPLWPRAFLATLSVLRLIGVLPKLAAPEWPPRRILLVNITANLGDALMMLPLVDALHTSLPKATIDLVVEPPVDAALRAIPWVRTVYRFAPDTITTPVLRNYARVLRMLRFASRELAHQPYDLALLPRWGTDPGLSSYLAAISTAPRRCGHDPADDTAAEQVLPNMAALLTDISHGGQGLAEGVREQLLLRACGLTPAFDPDIEERRPVQSVLAMGRSVDLAACGERLRLSLQTHFLLLAPGASHPARCWPPERFAALGLALHRDTGLAVYVIGGPSDRALGEQIVALSNGAIRNLAGQTSILEAIALTEQATLLITNDSGPAHVGGSVSTPTLVLSVCPKTTTREHANSPLRVRPVGPHVLVLQPDKPAPGCGDRCSAPTAHCILGLTVDSALSGARQLLGISP